MSCSLFALYSLNVGQILLCSAVFPAEFFSLRINSANPNISWNMWSASKIWLRAVWQTIHKWSVWHTTHSHSVPRHPRCTLCARCLRFCLRAAVIYFIYCGLGRCCRETPCDVTRICRRHPPVSALSSRRYGVNRFCRTSYTIFWLGLDVVLSVSSVSWHVSVVLETLTSRSRHLSHLHPCQIPYLAIRHSGLLLEVILTQLKHYDSQRNSR